VLKASFRWGAKKGYLTRSPISDDSALLRSKIAGGRGLVPDVLDDKGKLKTPGEERPSWRPLRRTKGCSG
jgi:hypothetical protein